MNDTRRARIMFMGSAPIALPLLDYLHAERERVELAGVLTQPDRPAGRGKKLTPNAVKCRALEQGLPVWQPEKPGAAEVGLVRELKIDLVLVMAYGHILKKDLLYAPPLGTYNVHASLLPGYRGASPIQGALASGEAETGVTLMKMVPRMDAGPVADAEKTHIEAEDTAATLEAKLARACVPLIRRNLDALVEGAIALREQDESRATYTRKLTKADAALDFARPAGELVRRIQALSPWPGARFFFEGTPVKASRARCGRETSASPPGTVLIPSDDAFRVATGEGVLEMLELQRPGGKRLPVPEFLRGFPVPPGAVLPSEPMTALVTRQVGDW